MSKQRMYFGVLIVALLLVLALRPAGAPRTLASAGPVRPSPDEAIAAAVNDLAPTAGGYRLRHPHHTASFTPQGIAFRPHDGGPTWTWRLTAVTAGGNPLDGVAAGALRPANGQPLAVLYQRGGLVEQYLAKTNTIEQQFLIPRPLSLGGADLVIAGAVQSAGAFEEIEDGWRWGTPDGGVRLGRVLVYDAVGALLPATMAVTAGSTRIAVDGAALARAAYPVTVDPEIGTEFVVSSMGPDADPDYDALNPAVAYNSTDNEFLVVWSGADDVVGEYEIWGQRLNAANGALMGANSQISAMGLLDDPAFDAQDPDVAYNSASNEYLVVWSADHYADNEFEIFGQRLNAGGAPIGGRLRVSVMGGSANPDYDAVDPAVAYNSTDNEYLVVWSGDNTGGTLLDDEFEIWGKLLEGDADWIGADFRISDMGGIGDEAYDGRAPDVAYNSTDNQYMVVWEGDDRAYNRADNEFEIWGQRLNASGGEMGAGDFRISRMGPDNDPDYDAFDPAIAYDSQDNQYLVVWEGETLRPDVFDILGQRLAANGLQVGADDFVLSNPGSGPNADYDAYNPAVAYDGASDEYLVVWQDDELGVGEYEIFGQRVDAATGAALALDTRLSDMGPDGNADHIAQTPALTYSSPADNKYVVAWSGDNNTDGEFEIWVQGFIRGFEVFLPLTLKDY